MKGLQTRIRGIYNAFNRRDIDGALAMMSESVSWPKASEGGRVTGKQEIRAYWTRQWAEFDPTVEPLDIIEQADGAVDVTVHQIVRSLVGDVLSDSVVLHRYTFRDGLMESMTVQGGEGSFGARHPE